MSTPADRSERIARQQADRRARRIRADIANRRAEEPALGGNLAASYREQGYGSDGYPLDYPQDLKNL